MITAQEARNIANGTNPEELKYIEDTIRIAAEICEAAHILPQAKRPIIGYKFYKEQKYPEYIMIEFENGAVEKYKRN